MSNGVLIKTDEKHKLLKDIHNKIETLFSLYDEDILRLECDINKKFGKSKIILHKIEFFK